MDERFPRRDFRGGVSSFPSTPSFTVPRPSRSRPSAIRLRGVRQNNLQGFDLDLPLGRFTVVTGLSGAGKSSLVFDTLHAEGQRRYVETFSAYTRQFLDLLEKPAVDSIENIRPSIAIEQSNTVRTTRSTVGTMTELCDFFKVWFCHVATLIDPETGKPVHDDSPATIWKKARAAFPEAEVLAAFPLHRPENLSWEEIARNLAGQGYARVALPATGLLRIEELAAAQLTPEDDGFSVVQDRVRLDPTGRSRFTEAIETALHFGRGECALLDPAGRLLERYSTGLRSPHTGRTFKPASPALFSFNSPVGACPRCRGFGRIIEIDYHLALPDTSRSINDGVVKAFEGQVFSECQRDLLRAARRAGIDLDRPFRDLPADHQAFVLEGDPAYLEARARGDSPEEKPGVWYGVRGFFDWLETKTYKMHVRIFLSRFRAYRQCPDCGGTRLQSESLLWRWENHTLPDLYALPVSALLPLIEAHAGSGEAKTRNRQLDLALDSILTRLRYLDQVGLGYLSLDRSSRTLSGGEVERVNLTACLGTSLVETLFVLDEPSVGLHSRDINRLIAVIHRLTAAGNTVVVVEHDESIIRAADHVVEIGPQPGAGGGRVVFTGSVPQLLRSRRSITGAYLSGRRSIDPPARRRPAPPFAASTSGAPFPNQPTEGWLVLKGVTCHNLRGLDVAFPLQRFVCLSGVSGSGKSTLLDHGLHQGLLARAGKRTEDPAAIAAAHPENPFSEIVFVDQSPLGRTPRSNPAIYSGSWDTIRSLFARTPESVAMGLTPAHFSFNSGEGRCPHCQGLGYEKVEMQFLSDVFIPCSACGGRRFRDEILELRWRDHSLHDLLESTIESALSLFGGIPAVLERLTPLAEVGLGYLRLGQPLTTLSGGESQRLKLVRYLGAFAGRHSQAGATPNTGALLLLDEPTTGLHLHDIRRLVGVFQQLVDHGHSLIVIEHHPDVLKCADWMLELGPEAGDEGGRVVAAGSPETLAAADCASAPFLARALGTPGIALRAAEPAAPYRAAANGRPPDRLELVGAREHNLRDLSVSIRHRQLTVITGVSGSGKSTLAFDIIFGEGQRRFMESMSPYARQFVEQLPRADLDRLTGIPPTVAIEQRVTRGSRKSTVATITEVAQYLRLLYARLGVQHHPDTGRPLHAPDPGTLAGLLQRNLRSPTARRARQVYLCAPLVRGRKGHHQPVATWAGARGYQRLRVDGRIILTENFTRLDRYREHDLEVVVAALKGGSADPEAALAEALGLGKGTALLCNESGTTLGWLSTRRTDPETGESFPDLDPKHFSFNSPKGWCPLCRGHGRIHPGLRRHHEEENPELAALLEDIDDSGEGEAPICPDCLGARLNRVSRSVHLYFNDGSSRSLPRLLSLTAPAMLAELARLTLDDRGRLIAADLLVQIEERLRFMDRVGLDYLTLDRETRTLSGGEAQRIRLAAQLGSNLSGVLYVLDEPSIGLHTRDNHRLIETLGRLRDRGNTLLVVEHDDEIMRCADRIIDLGPGAGIHGGTVLAEGPPAAIRRHPKSLTGAFLRRGLAHPLRGSRRALPTPPGRGRNREWLELRGARLRNLQGFDLRLPLGRLSMVCGVSGAGKSTLVRDLLHPAVEAAIRSQSPRLTGARFVRDTTGHDPADRPFHELRGGTAFRKVIEVDQSPIGKTPRSTPATYLGAFDLIRDYFARLPESRIHGYTAGRFSFNTPGGRCETCAGAGRVRLEMNFLPETYLPCEDCGGSRYGPELAALTWRDKSIADILALSFEEAESYFSFHDKLREICRLMVETGLGYLTLGQSSPTLSGGEAQRLKLVTELARGLATRTDRIRGELPRNLYLLEEPTIGLHLSDCEKLIQLLHRLVDQGHTVVVIEHHLDLLAEADYLVEIGPEGGPGGGRLLFQGPPERLASCPASPTRSFLLPLLEKSTRPRRRR
ncbi:MAG: excinuclease ABC subunit A [Puniceicoccaceae bacterium]|nr:MAG: excinuclease ABC subunit A [Puniceicoccaceae bacterium]